MPPFRLDEKDAWVYDHDDHDQQQGSLGRGEPLRVPSVHVVGKEDFVLEHSLKLHAMCDPARARLVVHGRGHEIPGDKENVALIGAAVRELGLRAMFG